MGFASKKAAEAKLPDGRKIKMAPSANGRRYKHRVYVECACCASWLPIGRIDQHVKSKKCKNASMATA
jgi:hypothetical protein